MKDILRRISFISFSFLLIFSSFNPVDYAYASTLENSAYNYAEALQKSLYFYEANKCGPGISDTYLQWRGDCHIEDSAIPLDTDHTNLSQNFINSNRAILDPDGDGAVDLSGGFHDAGDHVKFGLPQGYTASTIGWGYYEFKDAFVQTGQDQHALEILKWFSDYFMKTTFLDEDGEVIAFNYMVGDGTTDHNYWGPSELQLNKDYARPATFATQDTPASDQAGEAAAALALMYLNYKDVDSVYANKCLTYAKALYKFGREYRGLGISGGFYNSRACEDDLSWAAIWLYVITDNLEYIRHIDSVDADGNYTGYLSKILTTTENTWQNIWTHCWDAVWGGVFTKLACTFPENTLFDYAARWNLCFWTGGQVPHDEPYENTYLESSPAGYAFLNIWGSARYNTAAQFLTLVYQKYHTERTGLTDWAKGQMDYILGDNPMGYSYLVGFTENHVEHPHHRAAHGSTVNDVNYPKKHQHTLWGALAAGPDSGDHHIDHTRDYIYNEVAIDYNAAFVGALAGHYLLYEQDDAPLANFPPLEPEKEAFYVETKLEQENNQRTQVTIRINNRTSQPPRFVQDLSCRYYFNIEELFDVGQSINNVTFDTMYDEQVTSYEGSVEAKGPFKFDDGGTYYMEFVWKDMNIHGKRDYQFALVADIDSTWQFRWNGANDYSRKGINKEYKKNINMPVYVDGDLVYGKLPTPLPPYEHGTGGNNNSPISFEYTYAEKQNWGSGFVGALTIKNTGDQAISDWEISFNMNARIDKFFSADIVEHNGNHYIIKGKQWNKSLSPGQSYTLEFIGEYHEEICQVENVTIE